jgi:EmrB/QacA subfamily drug resistance transporter
VKLTPAFRKFFGSMKLFETILPGRAPKPNLAAAGVMLVIFLFAIDATIVSTSMPTIVGKLGGLELYSWVFSLYMLTSALATPLFGKLSDLFSRQRLMLVGIGIFVTGSALCGAAQSMEMLVLFRAVQGLGGGAIYALAFIIVGILYPPEERAKMQGIISSIWGIASILGPLAGGIITEYWNWRWIFFVNLPVAGAATALIVRGLGENRTEHRYPDLDFKGAATLLAGLMLLFYVLARSAHASPPLDTDLTGMLVLAVTLLFVFGAIERRAREPIIPLDLFHSSLFRTSTGVITFASMGVFGAISYFPLYVQGVLGHSASRAGIVLLLLSLGWAAGSLIGGQVMNRAGYRLVGVAGMALMALGYGLFLFPQSRVGLLVVLLNGFLIGTGMGLVTLTTLVAAQSAVPIHRIGVATSTSMLFRTFGGAFGISLMGSVLFNRMHHRLAGLTRDTDLSAALSDNLANPQNLMDPATRSLVPDELLAKLVDALAQSIWYAFLTALALMSLGLVLSSFMSRDTPSDTHRTREQPISP